MRDIIENIQYYYECYNGAKRRRENVPMVEADAGIDFEEDEQLEDLTIDSLHHPSEVLEVTNEDIEAAYEFRGTMRERLYAVALNTAFDCGVFSEQRHHTVFWPMVEKALSEDSIKFRAWEEHLKAVSRREVEEGGPSLFANIDDAAPGPSVLNIQPGIEPRHDSVPGQSSTGHRPKRDLLNEEQCRAHDIIERQLLRRLPGKHQLL
jgi:hypothetical protein